MKVYVVMCDENDGDGGICTSLDKVFFDEAKAEEYVKNENKRFSYCYTYVMEREVE
jgi:hypothetical protein